MRSRAAVVLAVAASLIGACGTPAASDSPPPDDGLRQITVEMNDSLRFAPALLEVSAGETVRFVVINDGSLDHEFHIGDEIAQGAHAQEMSSTGGRLQHSASGLGIKPRQREALVFTFAGAGSLIVGCHIPGHYGGGMKATIAIGP